MSEARKLYAIQERNGEFRPGNIAWYPEVLRDQIKERRALYRGCKVVEVKLEAVAAPGGVSAGMDARISIASARAIKSRMDCMTAWPMADAILAELLPETTAKRQGVEG